MSLAGGGVLLETPGTRFLQTFSGPQNPWEVGGYRPCCVFLFMALANSIDQNQSTSVTSYSIADTAVINALLSMGLASIRRTMGSKALSGILSKLGSNAF